MATKSWTETADFGSATINTRLSDAIITRHQGGMDSYPDFSTSNMPDASGETLCGWTMTNENGATSAVTFSNSRLNMTVKSEASDTKRFKYTHPLNANIAKNSTFTAKFGRVRFSDFGSSSGESLIGLFKSDDTDVNNSIRLRCGVDDTRFQVRDSGGTQDQDTVGSGLSTDTNYWLTIRGDGTNLHCDIYSSEANWIADSSGDVDRLTVAVSVVSGTVTCDVIGIRNFPAAAVTDSAVFSIEAFGGDSANWYDDCQANADDDDYAGLSRVDYSSLAVNTTGTVTPLFDLRKKSTAEGEYAADDNSGSHYTLAEVQALDDESLYGFGLVVYGDITPGETSASIDDVAIDYFGDTTAPDDMTDVSSAAFSVFDQVHHALSWNEPSAEDLSFIEFRRRLDSGSYEYLTTDGGIPTWSETRADNDGIYKFRYATGDSSSVTARVRNFVDRNVEYETAAEYWARSSDDDGNLSGWAAFQAVSLSSGGGSSALIYCGVNW